MKGWRKWRKALSEVFLANDEDKQPMQLDDIMLINEAKDELFTARHMFAEMEDPDMVDWAVYNVSAAEKRYDYLLKICRQKQEPEVSSKK